MKDTASKPEISFVVPVFNEEGTIKLLFAQIRDIMEGDVQKAFEILFVDDGSSDASWREISDLTDANQNVVGIRLKKNFGKADALNAGFQWAKGKILITMDADLQDDPREVPRFLEKLEAEFDMVVGWKKWRNDPWSKTVPSKVFNRITALVSGVKLKDFNCGFKAGTKEAFGSIKLYGELHRYIPVLCHHAGFRVGQISVTHHPRQHGKSKYGFERYVRGFLDLLTVISLTRYAKRPGHLFGGIGVVSGLFGVAILVYLAGLKLFFDEIIGNRPLLLLGVMLVLMAVQFLLFGILAELNLSQNHAQSQKPIVHEIKSGSDNSDAETL